MAQFSLPHRLTRTREGNSTLRSVAQVGPIGAVLLLAGLPGCQSFNHTVQVPRSFAGQNAIVFAADGAGGFEAASSGLRQAALDTQSCVHIATVHWTHGYSRVLADVLDREHARRKGHELAEEVLGFRACHPETAVHLVGHSAGCQVVLDAAEVLPPGSVERIVLLLPAVACDYDLRPALCCSRIGIDSFSSAKDVGYLGLWVGILGTSDGQHGVAAAGRTGFRPIIVSARDAQLYTKLREHPWDPMLVWTGNLGGHYGVYSQGYLRAFVLPLLNGPLR